MKKNRGTKGMLALGTVLFFSLAARAPGQSAPGSAGKQAATRAGAFRPSKTTPKEKPSRPETPQAGLLEKAAMNADKNGDGRVSRTEFLEAMGRVFDRLDADRDGALDKTEQALAAGRRADSVDKVKRLFLGSDKNKDGKLSPEEFGRAEKAFQKTDADADGFVTLEELGRVMKSLSRGPSEDYDLRSKTRKSLLERLDVNQDGKLSPEEFNGPAQMFHMIDADGDGQLSLEELTVMAKARRGGNPSAPVISSFEKMDADGDGSLSPKEFKGPGKAFQRMDANADGRVDREEMEKWKSRARDVLERKTKEKQDRKSQEKPDRPGK